jgi:23S rRNA (uridine2552-2'-O)-methyltransferase
MTVVDLGAAPGGWIQGAQEILQGEGYIVGLDLLPLQRDIGNTPGVKFIQGDFLDAVTWSKLRRALKDLTRLDHPTVDLVLSDMMGSMSGSPTRDAQISLDLSEAALEFAVQHLTPFAPPASSSADKGRAAVPPVQLIIKHFTSTFTADFRKELQRHFKLVKWVKPGSSRGESREGFFVCAGFKGSDDA